MSKWAVVFLMLFAAPLAHAWGIRLGGYTSPSETALIEDVAQSHTTIETVVDNWHVRAVYAGRWQGCAAVGLVNFDLKTVTSYKVCMAQAGGPPLVTARNGVAPAWTHAPGSQMALQSAVHGALLSGIAEVPFDGYLITSRSGNTTIGGCAMVETTITWQGYLVGNSTNRICQ